MTRKLLLGAVVALLAAVAFVPATASAAPQGSASVLGVVFKGAGGEKAYVTARYRCYTATHLWVAAKQMADGKKNPALLGEGSSQIADNYLQQHPVNFTCDGRNRIQTFVIDKLEPAPWDPQTLLGKGALTRGFAWIQFCLTEEAEQGEFIYATRWSRVV